MRKAMLLLAFFGIAGLLFMMPLSSFAQTKLVAVIDCDKADPQNTIPVPDREGFSYQIYLNKCTWTK